MFIFLISNLFAATGSTWKKPPQVLICDNSISEQIINDSIKKWHEKKHSIEKKAERHTCEFETSFYMQSRIMVSISKDMEENTLGETTNYYYKDGRIAYSIIKISRNATNIQRVYEHEIGHALGMKHSSMKEDVMFPTIASSFY
tara:strand:+ start:40 stop:471 length:432 start_codon:yes stop_codon:yes gene_type:complete